MEFARRMWSQIGAQLEGVSLQTKALIAALTVILLLIAGFLMFYAGAEEKVAFAPAGSNPGEAVAKLSQAGIDADVAGGMIRVAPDQFPQAYGVLQQDGLFGEDASVVFDRMFQSQSPWETDKRDQQRAIIAQSRFLAGAIQSIQGVKSAQVMYDPGQDGIGNRHVRASAMATITTASGQVSTELADSVAAMISGAVAKIDMADVKIVDARTGRRVAVSDPNNMLPSDALEVKRNIEERKRREVENILDYIPGVRVGVNVLLDSVASRQERRREYEKEQLIQSESNEERSRKNIANAGEPGPRSNTGLSINGSGGAGTEENENKTLTEFFESKPILLEQDTVLVGNQVKQINVAINVPRSYFVGLYKQQNPDAQGEPDNAAIIALVQPELNNIEQKVKVLTLTDVEGLVKADMVPDAPAQIAAGTASTVRQLLDGGWGGTAGLSVLALAALGLMLKLYRTATRPETLPSIEELAGVPPSLPSDEELIGEADESETSMQGVELNEEDLRARRIAEQIGELVRADPAEASRLLGKWVSTNE